jgi:hypothetical protein
VTSATGFTVGYYALVDKEIVKVSAINGTLISVAPVKAADSLARRSVTDRLFGIRWLWLFGIGHDNAFYSLTPSGPAPLANVYSPTISLETGDRFECLNGEWTNILKDEIVASYTMLAQRLTC